MRIKKILITVLLFTVIFFNFGIPAAQAQFDTGLSGIIVTTFTRIWDVMRDTASKIFDFVKSEAVTNAIQMFSSQFAKQLATDLASSGEGGKPLFYTKNIGDYISDASSAAAGEFLGSLSEVTWATLGLNLCDPDLNVKLRIQAGLLEQEDPVQPKCEWKDIEKNWNEFAAKMDEGAWMDYVTFSFEPGKSDISSYLLLTDEAEKRKQESEREAALERLKSDWQPVTTRITNEIKTAGDLIAEEAKALVPKGVLDIGLQTKWQNAYLSKNILAPFLSTFTNTLISKLGERFIKKGFWSLSDVVNQGGSSGGGGSGGSQYYTGGYTGAQAQVVFGGLLSPNISTIEDFQQLEDYIICNTQQPIYGNKLNNCVLDPNFYSALFMDPPITLWEAVYTYQLIPADKEFVGPDDSRNKNPSFCYNEAFCYGNLQRLRQSRIIPLGWEIAAAKSTNTPVTLSEAMNNYDNQNSPLYRLVDPDWILRAPSAQCQANVFSAILESPQSSSRHQSCVDPMTCIKENDDGSCENGAYGRCTQEKNIWRLGGDTCDAWYNTCQTLTKTSDNSTESYITESLEECPSDAAGCKWYSTEQIQVSGQWTWQEEPRIYFDQDVDECDAQADGCSQFIRTVPGSNLIYNGNFEIDEDSDDVPDGWSGMYIEEYANQGLNGSMSIKNSTGPQPRYDSSIQIIPNQYYTLSGWAKPVAVGNNLPEPTIFLENTSGNSVGQIISYYGSSAYQQPANQLKVKGDVSANAANNNGWYFISVTFLANPNESYPFDVNLYLTASLGTLGDSQAWFDNLQLEKSATPSNYYNYGAVNLTYLKKAPDYYECQGYTNKVTAYNDETSCEGAGFFWRTDIEACVEGGDPLCSNYALYCQETEVGCQAYTPANGDPMVPGVAQAQDYCPAECVGYQTYQEDPTYFDLIEDPTAVSTSQNLIAATAQECSSTELNCEEFTNLDIVAQGGEGKEYYTYLRQCVLPDHPAVSSYYTWEGSDTTGFQLKTWDLLESDADNAPCTNVNIDVPVNSVVCQDTGANIQVCDPLDNDPNCREFFDEGGNSHYRLQDRTITASDSCQPYRRIESNVLYNAIPSEGNTCSPAANGCRQYRGNTSSNVRIVFSDDFEDGDTLGWEGGVISNESVYINDHSFKAQVVNNPHTAQNTSILASKLTQGKEYQVSLIAKKSGSGSMTISPILSNGSESVSLGTAVVTDDWQQIILGPVTLDHEVDANLEALWLNPSNDFFVDSILIKELNNNLYLIKDSWQTPISCDNPIENPQGQSGSTTGNRTFIGAMLGCQEYEDSNNNTVYLHSFSQLCSEEVAGCEAMIDTYNSNSPFDEVFNDTNSSPLDDLSVPEDNYIYLVNDENKSCFSSEKGCQALGLPDIDRTTGDVTSYEDVVLINDPDKYSSILCQDENLFCEEYRSGTAGEGYSYYSYFDPGNRLCEYQVNKIVGSTPVTGWFKVNSLEACSGGTDYTLYPADSSGFDGWAGLCPAEQSGCTEFIDSYASVSDNKITNPGFENNFDGNSVPDYYVEVGNGLLEYSNTEGINGTKAVKTTLSGANSFYQGVTFEAGETYRISIYASSTPYSILQFQIKVNDCDDPNVEFESADSKFDTTNPGQAILTDNATNSYLEYSGQLTSKSGSDVTCNLNFGGTGSSGIWFDNLAFKKIESYYNLNNEKLDRTTCSNQASLVQGCVLFNDTSQENMSFDSLTTYQNSAQNNNGLVNPEICTTGEVGCDANSILKVVRDRTCAEWYSCVSSVFVNDPANPSNLKEQCTQLALCNEFSTSATATGQCANWVINENPEILDEQAYINRDTSWGGRDYSGYSIYDQYQIDATQALDVYDVPDPANEKEIYRLVVPVGDGANPTACGNLGVSLGLYSDYNQARLNTPWLLPVYANGKCLLGLDGLGLHCTDLGADPQECNPNIDPTNNYDHVGDVCGNNGACELGESIKARGYASQESPFPFEAWLTNNQYYSYSNICIDSQEAFDALYNVDYQGGSTDDRIIGFDENFGDITLSVSPDGTGDCETSYKKVEYGGGAKIYYFADGVNIPKTIYERSIVGGTDPITYAKTKVTNFINWGGYCLEDDTSRLINGTEQACVTWLPQDIVSGGLDINNLYQSAGYVPQSDEEYYCLQAKGNWQGENGVPTTFPNETTWGTVSRYVYTNRDTDWYNGNLTLNQNNDDGSICGNGNASGSFACRIDCPGYTGRLLPNCSENISGWSDARLKFDVYGTTIEKTYNKREIKKIVLYHKNNNGDPRVAVLSEANNWRCQMTSSVWPTPPGCEGLGYCPGDNPGGGESLPCFKDLQVFFDSDGNFDYIHYQIDHPPGGVGDFVLYTPLFYLREPCEIISQIVDGDDYYAWTNRVWTNTQNTYKDSNLAIVPDPDPIYGNYPNVLPAPYLDYTYSQTNIPGGMAYQALNSLGSPSNQLWYVEDSYLATQGENAGSAYSCDDNCSGRMCIGGVNDGDVCSSSADCPAEDPSNPLSPLGVCIGIGGADGGTTGGGISASNKSPDWAAERLSQLFAKSFNTYIWNWDTLQYEPSSQYQWDIRDETELYSTTQASNYYHEGPFIHAVDVDGSRLMSPYNNVTINNFSGTGSLEASEQLMANMKFYFYSHGSSMPTRKIRIDWGDGSPTLSEEGYYLNRYAPGECSGNSYGRQKGKTCSEAPYQASHLYSYALAPETGYECNGDLPGEPNIPGAKCFKPRVQITDNWGWCNGGKSLTSGSYVSGAWDPESNGDCQDLEQRSAKFEGWIVVTQ